MALTKAEREASKMLTHLQIEHAPVDVEAIAQGLGIEVNYEPLDSDVSGVMLFQDGKVKVAVNRDHHPNRQRFTLSHEIGHFVLHASQNENRVFVDRRYFRNDASSRGEWKEEIEANSFGASLLMPRKLIDQYLVSGQEITDIDIFRLATKFQVSEQAMTLRLVKLGYIQPD